jgi:hypothetical protein
MFYILLAILFALATLGATIFVLVEAFRDEIWKGVLGLFCSLYLLWFAVFDWDHEWKWLFVALMLGGSAVTTGLLKAAG